MNKVNSLLGHNVLNVSPFDGNLPSYSQEVKR